MRQIELSKTEKQHTYLFFNVINTLYNTSNKRYIYKELITSIFNTRYKTIISKLTNLNYISVQKNNKGNTSFVCQKFAVLHNKRARPALYIFNFDNIKKFLEENKDIQLNKKVKEKYNYLIKEKKLWYINYSKNSVEYKKFVDEYEKQIPCELTFENENEVTEEDKQLLASYNLKKNKTKVSQGRHYNILTQMSSSATKNLKVKNKKTISYDIHAANVYFILKMIENDKEFNKDVKNKKNNKENIKKLFEMYKSKNFYGELLKEFKRENKIGEIDIADFKKLFVVLLNMKNGFSSHFGEDRWETKFAFWFARKYYTFANFIKFKNCKEIQIAHICFLKEAEIIKIVSNFLQTYNIQHILKHDNFVCFVENDKEIEIVEKMVNYLYTSISIIFKKK